jgi:hypothetical protein
VAKKTPGIGEETFRQQRSVGEQVNEKKLDTEAGV